MRRSKLFLFHLLIFIVCLNVHCELLNNEISVDEPREKNIDDLEDNVILLAKDVRGDDDDDAGDDGEKETAEEVEERVEEIERMLPDFENMTLEEAYKAAVNTYLDEHWDECIVGFNHVIQRYKNYRDAVINCRRKCQQEVVDEPPIFVEDIENLHFYEQKIRETLCLLNCNQDHRDAAGAQALKRLPTDVEKQLVQFKPYEYLHICYYQRNRFQEAANAIFTYLAFHQKHEMSLKNLRYYLTLPEVNENEIINLEIAEFIPFYMKGVKAYEEEFYDEAVENFEKSLNLYMKAEDDCRLYCEGPFDQGWHPEFTSSIANHFVYCLKCKRICSRALNNFNGDYQSDLLPSHYNYLQFAYYKLGVIKHTCQAVESYLLFYPADETMLSNKDYYSKLPKVDQENDYFIPRPEAVSYVKRQEYELRILRFIADEFAAIDTRIQKSKKSENIEKLLKHFSFAQLHASEIDNVTHTRVEASWRESQTKVLQEIRVVARDKELGGEQRYLAEGLLGKMECKTLVQLAEKAAIEGDGYDDNKSPHSELEKFEGVTIGRAALMVYFGLLEPNYLHLFLQTSELARRHVEQYFSLKQPLYFTYTHLVCRSALPGLSSKGTTFSHEIHADNCLAIKEGICLHQSPAFTWRDYSAIVYLNDGFDGGEFVFAADPKAKIIQSTVKPRCGRMVGFSADEKNLHGVQGVKTGKRCALALWFTMDKSYIESERRLAEIILDRVSLKGPVNISRNFTIPIHYERILSTKFRDDAMLKLLSQIS